MTDDLLFKDEVYAIIGAAMEVHSQLCPGFLESVYEEAMEIESELKAIPFVTQQQIPVYYKKRELKKKFQADYIGFGKILVEFKCVPVISSKEEAQVLNYLKATLMKVGLLINFASHGKLEWKRYIL